MRYSDELYHFGVKGMKWGVRRIRDRVKSHIANRKAAKLMAQKQPAWNYYWGEIRKDYRKRCDSDDRFKKAYRRYERASYRASDFYNNEDPDWTKNYSQKEAIIKNQFNKASRDVELESSRVYKESKKAVSKDVKNRYGYDPSIGDFDDFYKNRAIDKDGKDAVWRLYAG